MGKVILGIFIGAILTTLGLYTWNLVTTPKTATPTPILPVQVIQSSPAPAASILPTTQNVEDYKSFISYIKGLGLNVASETKAVSDLYGGDITEIKTNGESIYVLEYPNEIDSRQMASQISPDASTITKVRANGTSQIITIDRTKIPTYYFHKGKLIVIYAGNNEAIAKILEEVLGPKFAGHS